MSKPSQSGLSNFVSKTSDLCRPSDVLVLHPVSPKENLRNFNSASSSSASCFSVSATASKPNNPAGLTDLLWTFLSLLLQSPLLRADEPKYLTSFTFSTCFPLINTHVFCLATTDFHSSSTPHFHCVFLLMIHANKINNLMIFWAITNYSTVNLIWFYWGQAELIVAPE